jgi:hypothetical protein
MSANDSARYLNVSSCFLALFVPVEQDKPAMPAIQAKAIFINFMVVLFVTDFSDAPVYLANQSKCSYGYRKNQGNPFSLG